MNRRVATILTVTALWACGGSTTGATGESGVTAKVPLHHRPNDAPCSQPPPAAGCGFTGGTCSKDTDCTSDAGANGRCIEPSTNICSCTYDACSGDGACATGQTCACHGTPYTGSLGNTCMPGNCRVDSDCGAKGYCSPAPSTQCGAGSATGLTGYYCHTAMDLCVDDSDCPTLQNPSDPNDPTFQTCGYSMGRWQCQPVPICGG